jgi:hypothetical protein
MLQGFGLEFLIVPITQVAYFYLPAAKNDKASSLTKLFRNKVVYGRGQVTQQLPERRHALKFPVRRRKPELVFRHRLCCRNKLMLHVRYGAVQHFRDGSMFILALIVLGRTNCRQRQNECKTAKFLPHYDSSHFPLHM